MEVEVTRVSFSRRELCDAQSCKSFCDKTQFPLFQFCCPHIKPHVLRGLSKYYHMQLYPKLGHGPCEIR